MLNTENKLNSLALVGVGFQDSQIASIQEYLEILNPNVRLFCIEPGASRINFLESLKSLIKSKDILTTQDLQKIEFQPDLIIKFGDQSLGDSFVLGASYSEIAFCDQPAQNFCLEDLKIFLEDFENRKRNFGS